MSGYVKTQKSHVLPLRPAGISAASQGCLANARLCRSFMLRLCLQLSLTSITSLKTLTQRPPLALPTLYLLYQHCVNEHSNEANSRRTYQPVILDA